MNRTQRVKAYLLPAACLLLAASCPAFAQEPAASTSPVIVSAVADLVHGQITITGQRLTPATGSPVVTLDGKTLTLVSSASTQIVADLPAGLGTGTFDLIVNNGMVEVSWQVTGIRQDAWANAHRIPLEIEKPAMYQGHYLHPELFGHEGDPSIGEMHHPRPTQRQP